MGQWVGESRGQYQERIDGLHAIVVLPMVQVLGIENSAMRGSRRCNDLPIEIRDLVPAGQPDRVFNHCSVDGQQGKGQPKINPSLRLSQSQGCWTTRRGASVNELGRYLGGPSPVRTRQQVSCKRRLCGLPRIRADCVQEDVGIDEAIRRGYCVAPDRRRCQRQIASSVR